MLNFAVGPVKTFDYICNVGAEQVPYFRTDEFSNVMWENERLIKKFAKADENTRIVFLTGSGTAAMETVVMNCFDEKDKVLVVNGGSFGQRFVELCQIYQVPFTELKLNFAEPLTKEMLLPYQGQGYTCFLINLHETSTGVYYDIDMIAKFCRQNKLFLVVDAISSFLADSFDMAGLCVDVMITSSQKVLACPPGISIIALSEKAVVRVQQKNVHSMYFDLRNALKNAERGQTPFTPAVGILLQINARLRQIEESGGAEYEIERIAALAADFRQRIAGLPLQIASRYMSNAMTPLHPLNVSAYEIFKILKDKYDIWVCPNGGSLRDEIFRVGHMGALTWEDNSKLIEALQDLQKRGLI